MINIIVNNSNTKDSKVSSLFYINYLDKKDDTSIVQSDTISIDLNIGYKTKYTQNETYTINSDAIKFQNDNNITLAFDDNYLFLALSYSSINGVHEMVTESKYSEILNILDNMNYTNLVRVWNYIPSINEDNPEGLENYKDFCAGRSKAFMKHYENSHYQMPSASAVGINGDKNIIYLIAKREDTHNKIYHIENPRQIPAYRYPKQYGEKSPSFARATLDVQDDILKLFVSGTASIIGHKSIHDNVIDQTLETIKNIKSVSSIENLNKYTNIEFKSPFKIEQAKVYVKNESDIAIVKKIWEDEMQCFNTVYCHTDICRRELLVEIECIFTN